MSKEFCPSYCNEPEKFCSPSCHHHNDKSIKPFQVSVKKTRKEWLPSTVVGENQDDWIILVGNWDDIPTKAYIKKNSPLIRN